MTPRILQPAPELPNTQHAQISHAQWLNHPSSIKHINKLSQERDRLVQLSYSNVLLPDKQALVINYIQRAAILNQTIQQLLEQP